MSKLKGKGLLKLTNSSNRILVWSLFTCNKDYNFKIMGDGWVATAFQCQPQSPRIFKILGLGEFLTWGFDWKLKFINFITSSNQDDIFNCQKSFPPHIIEGSV